jgi:hypothetical protein
VESEASSAESSDFSKKTNRPNKKPATLRQPVFCFEIFIYRLILKPNQIPAIPPRAAKIIEEKENAPAPQRDGKNPPA